MLNNLVEIRMKNKEMKWSIYSVEKTVFILHDNINIDVRTKEQKIKNIAEISAIFR